MDKNRIIASVRMRIPNVDEIMLNQYITDAMNKLNMHGISSVRKTAITTTASGDLQAREHGQTANFYTADKALILPDALVKIYSIYYDGTLLIKDTYDNFVNGYMITNGYCTTNDNVLYTNVEMETGKYVTINGLWGSYTIDMLPDKYENWLTSYVLTSFYAIGQLKDADQYQIWKKECDTAWRSCHNSGNTLNRRDWGGVL